MQLPCRAESSGAGQRRWSDWTGGEPLAAPKGVSDASRRCMQRPSKLWPGSDGKVSPNRAVGSVTLPTALFGRLLVGRLSGGLVPSDPVTEINTLVSGEHQRHLQREVRNCLRPAEHERRPILSSARCGSIPQGDPVRSSELLVGPDIRQMPCYSGS